MGSQGDNALWYRVAGVRPRLVAHAELQKQIFRGDAWYVLHNLVSGRAYRFTPRFHYFIALLDGRRTVEELWQASNAVLGEDALSQDEVMEILARLYLADVLQSNEAGDAFELFERQRRQRHAQRMAQAKSPLAIRVPLFDPDRLLERLAPLAARLLTIKGLMAWCALVLAGATAAFVNWGLIIGGNGPQLLSPQNLLLLGLCYPFIKALHELGHGLTTKVWGGEVHQAGILLVAFIPLPYVDASAANTFPEKYRRIVVSSAGIMVELALAVVALFLWLAVEPGLIRNIAYNVMVIGSISTLFFNGNPLLRFDGYYVLVDAAGLPNLAARSTKYLGYLIKRYAFGLASQRSPATHASEPPWLLTYGVLAYVYRIFILLVIAMFVAESYPTIGVALAFWSIASAMIWPVAKQAGKLFTDPELERRRGRALGLSAAMLLIVASAVFIVPAPLATVTEGVVVPPKDAEIRAARAGIFARFVTVPDATVKTGQDLIEMTDPFLAMEIVQLEAQLRELSVRRKTLQSERKQVEVDMLDEDIHVVEANLARAREDVAALHIQSTSAGVFLVAETVDLPGRFVEQGELLGYVADLEHPTVRVAVAQADVGLVKTRTERVTVRLAERPQVHIEARIVRQVPGAIDSLPSAALGARGGGPFAVDPQDESGTRPLESVFEFELALPVEIARLGGRTYVRFEHGSEPLGQQWFRRLRQLFLRRFSV